MTDIVADLKGQIRSEKLVIGTKLTVKGLKLGELASVYLSRNVPDQVKGDIEHYAKLSQAAVHQLSMPNDELGTFCKKPFSISVLGLRK